jgi:hypothetical protein
MTAFSPAAPSDDIRATRVALWLVLVLTGLRLAALLVTPLELYPDEAQYWLCRGRSISATSPSRR